MVELKKRRNPNPSLRDHEERLTEVEDFMGELRGYLEGMKKALRNWGLILVSAFAASGIIDGRAAEVIGRLINAAAGGT